MTAKVDMLPSKCEEAGNWPVVSMKIALRYEKTQQLFCANKFSTWGNRVL